MNRTQRMVLEAKKAAAQYAAEQRLQQINKQIANIDEVIEALKEE